MRKFETHLSSKGEVRVKLLHFAPPRLEQQMGYPDKNVRKFTEYITAMLACENPIIFEELPSAARKEVLKIWQVY